MHHFTQENIIDAVKNIVLKKHHEQFINAYINEYRTCHCLWHPHPYLAHDAKNQVEPDHLIDSKYEFHWRCDQNQNRCNCLMSNGDIRELNGRLKAQQCRFIKTIKDVVV